MYTRYMKNKSYVPIKESTVNFLILICSIVTLYFNTKFEDPFNVPKQLVLFLGSAWVAGHVIYAFRHRRPEIIFKQYILFTLTLLFIVGMFVAALFTDVRTVAFFGDTQRRNGFLTYLALIVLFLFAIFAVNFTNILKVFKSILILNLILGTYGLLQIFGRDPYEWNNPYNSMISTLGNPNFSSSILAVFAAVSFFSYFVKRLKLFWKITATMNVFISLFAIVQSESRQGILVFSLSLIIFIVILVLNKDKKLGFIVLVPSIALILLAVFGMLQRGPLSSLLYKDSISVRGYYWRAGYEMFRDNPIFGIGVDRYGEYFKQYREAAYAIKYGFEITSSNAHNTFIQFFATSGLVVGLSYLLLVSYIIFVGFQGIKETSGVEKRIILAILSAYIGFQSQSLISIDNIGISVWGWLLGGAILGLRFSNLAQSASSVKATQPRSEVKNVSRSSRSQATLNTYATAFSILVLAPTIYISSGVYQSETSVALARYYAYSKLNNGSSLFLKYAEQALSNNFTDNLNKLKLAALMLDLGMSDQGLQALQTIQRDDPRKIDTLKVLAVTLRKQNQIEKELIIREQMSIFDPYNTSNYREMIQLNLLQGDTAIASALVDSVKKYDPNWIELNTLITLEKNP